MVNTLFRPGERKKGGGGGGGQHKEKHKDSHTLTNYTQGWAPMHLPSGRQLELGWGKRTLEYIYSVRLLLKHTWLRKADSATCMLPLIILFTSLLDLKATGPLYYWATSKETGRTGPARRLTAFRWTIGDINLVQRLTVRKWGLSSLCWMLLSRHEAHRSQTKSSCCHLIMAVKKKEKEDTKYELTINGKKRFCLNYEFGFIGNVLTIWIIIFWLMCI